MKHSRRMLQNNVLSYIINLYINCISLLQLISEKTTIIVNGRFRSNENFYMTHLMTFHSLFLEKIFYFSSLFVHFNKRFNEFLIINITFTT